tara:strand:- start:95 stop:310 length:216 start_codon:yes stop_codon:yes gene_type:complete
MTKQPESHTALYDACQEILRLEKVNAELLEALKCIVDVNPRLWDADVRDQFEPWAKNRARAAIAKATGEQA